MKFHGESNKINKILLVGRQIWLNKQVFTIISIVLVKNNYRLMCLKLDVTIKPYFLGRFVISSREQRRSMLGTGTMWLVTGVMDNYK